MPALANTGTLSYNGVTLTVYRSRIRGKPIMDAARRTVVFIEWTIDVHAWIAGLGATTDNTMASYRKLLTAAGGALTYQDKGFGALIVNTGSAVRDVAWGPQPELLDWTPIGNDMGCLVDWKCVVRIPECDQARYALAIMEFNYKADFQIDEDGYTTVSSTGHIVIPMSRLSQGNRALPDSADNYRERIAYQPPLGFKRKQQHFTVSEDKRRLDWTIVDEEIPAPLPNGASTMSAQHEVAWTFGQNKTAHLQCNLTANVVLPAGQPKSAAWEKFLLILRDRIDHARFPTLGGTWDLAFGEIPVFIPPSRSPTRQRMILVDNVRITDDIFGRGTQFAVSYRIFKAGLTDILTASGIWRPVPGTNWSSWARSLRDSAFHARGVARLGLRPADDFIIDLCGGQERLMQPSSTTRVATLRSGSLGSAAPLLEPQNSWVAYESDLSFSENDKVAVHQPLDAVSLEPPVTGTNPTDVSGGLNPPAPLVRTRTPAVTQRIGAPAYRVELYGFAIRAGYRIPLPRLNQVGGARVQQLHQQHQERYMGTIGGVPFYRTDWRLSYIVPGTPPYPIGTPSDAYLGY